MAVQGHVQELGDQLNVTTERVKVACTSCSWNTLIHFWIAADKLGDGILCNAINDDAKLWYHSNKESVEPPDLEDEDIALAWDNTVPGASLRELLLDAFIGSVDCNDAPRRWDGLCHQFRNELLTRAIDYAQSVEIRPIDRTSCDYHVHGKFVPYADESCAGRHD